MKTCNYCQVTKPLSAFYSHLRLNKTTGEMQEYTFPYCKTCNSQKKREKDRTQEGIAGTLYLSQCLHSRKRGYSPPTYTADQLRDWLFAQPNFVPLFTAWKASGFLSDLKPSCNRRNDYEGYSLQNIELTTWKGNKAAWASDCLAGKNTKISRTIMQYDLEGNLIQEFFSIQDASRKLGIPHANIIKTCTGIRNAAGGFGWKYKDPGSPPKHTGFIGRA